jgi:hypothetical protein
VCSLDTQNVYNSQTQMCLGSINMCMGFTRHILIGHLGRHEKRNTVILLYCLHLKPATHLRLGPLKSPWSGFYEVSHQTKVWTFVVDPPAQNTPKEKPLHFGNIIDQYLSLSLSLSLILQSHTLAHPKLNPWGPLLW